MPPKNNRSTGAFRIAFITSAGVTLVLLEAERGLRLRDSAISLAARGNTPPPVEISVLS